MSMLIRNGRVITPGFDGVMDLFIEGEQIAAIGKNLPGRADRELDASGRLVIPGGVDVHTHLDAPVGGTRSSDDFASGTRAAAYGGTTTIIDFATQEPGHSLLDAFDRWLSKGAGATIDFGLHMIVTDLPETRRSEVGRLVDEGVTSFKLFMAYPGALMLDDAAILRVMELCANRGALTCIHAENGTAIAHLIHMALARGETSPVFHALTRPPELEAEATHRAIALATLVRAPLYIVHVTCAGAVDEIRRAQERNIPVVGETCPHYLLLSTADLERPGLEGAKYVLTPPLRDPSHHQSLWDGLKRGTLQTVATDHCSFFFDRQKLADTTDFTRIPNGGPGIEHRLELLYHFGVNEGRLTLQQWVECVSAAPARIFGLAPKKGTIAAGSDADLVIWNPELERTISAANHRMNVDYSMYEGWKVTGGAETVISRGEIIIHDGGWHGTPGRGRYLRRMPHSSPAGRGDGRHD